MKKYALFLGNNFEDVEAVTQIDLLRRAGVTLDVYGVNGREIRSRSNLVYQTDFVFTTAAAFPLSDYAGLLIPGGPGTVQLAQNQELVAVVKAAGEKGLFLFAICAGPMVLDKAGQLKGHRYTCYPGTEIQNGTFVEEHVVLDGNIMTSRGVGTSLDAAIALVRHLVSPAEADKQAEKTLYHR